MPSRARSDTGRTPAGGAASRRPFAAPAITRTRPSLGVGSHVGEPRRHRGAAPGELRTRSPAGSFGLLSRSRRSRPTTQDGLPFEQPFDGRSESPPELTEEVRVLIELRIGSHQ
jgi:hypothetical protein